MNNYLNQVIKENGGIISSTDLSRAGINRKMLEESISKGIISKESHGRYVINDACPDEFYLVQNRSEKIIFSHATALYLHGLSDRVPNFFDVTVPQGDNVSRIKKDYDFLKFHYCKKSLWDLGLTTIKTPQGYEVQVYDLERCVCDLIKNKKKIDNQIYTQVIREYFGHSCNARKIVKYAREFNIEDKVRMYMEVIN